ncbi:hypothetical protein C8R44DRAFT_178078 [Mycena epipterygia]|nr:hypothetical protein C8R44DRAFT_178078 [Mycena epipterygia]
MSMRTPMIHLQTSTAPAFSSYSRKKALSFCLLRPELRHFAVKFWSLIQSAPNEQTQARDDVIRNPSPLEAPLLLLQICSRRRRIALATLEPWTELQTILTRITEPWTSRNIGLLQYWLANAKWYPISLAAKCHSPAVLRQVMTTAHLLKKLHLQA